ncbi:MAG: endonuclease, partial [Bacteroidales bacterium]|nr:endonuclease [Bacteroidales bacterium]
WEAIDQFIVSQPLLDSISGIYTSGEYLRIFSPDFLLRKDQVYPGMSPYSAWRGYKFQGGFSDHLPVLLELRFREHYQPE